MHQTGKASVAAQGLVANKNNAFSTEAIAGEL